MDWQEARKFDCRLVRTILIPDWTYFHCGATLVDERERVGVVEQRAVTSSSTSKMGNSLFCC